MKKEAEVTLFPKHARDPKQVKRWQATILETFREHLTQQGLSLTRQREEILQALMQADMHMEAEALYDLIKKKDPSIGRATIFRTLKLLQECGLVAEVSTNNGRSKFEVKADRPHHDHMICLGCGRVFEFRDDRIEALQKEVCAKHGFTSVEHHLGIRGYCDRCDARHKAAS